MRALLVIAVLCALAALASAQWSSGVWRSDYGGTNAPWYICIGGGGTKFYATYSLIGYVEGTLSGLTMNGMFYEAGASYGDKEFGGYYGNITLTWNIDTNDISGTWTDLSGYSVPASGTWTLTFESSSVVPRELCWDTPTTFSKPGIPGKSWYNSTDDAVWDFCSGKTSKGITELEGSYWFDDGWTEGAVWGYCYVGGTVCTLIYEEVYNDEVYSGQWLIKQVAADKFYSFGWSGYPNTEANGVWYPANDDTFGSYGWSLRNQPGGDCGRNSYLFTDHPTTSSASTSVVVSAALLAIALVLSLAMF